jgi:dolichol-phosphate mannosyltransferase
VQTRSLVSQSDAPQLTGRRTRAALGIIIPTLQEASNIQVVLDRVRRSLDGLGIDYELLVVDDNSGDGIESIVSRIAAEDKRVRILVRNAQRGLSGAIFYGWQHTDAEVLGVIDADLQHPPEILPSLWKAIGEGNDVAVASRYAAADGMKEWNPLRRLLSRISTYLATPFQKKAIRIQDPLSGFFLVRRACLEGLQVQQQGFKILLEILVCGNVRSVAEVPFVFGQRAAGESKAGLSTGLNYLWLLRKLWHERKT